MALRHDRQLPGPARAPGGQGAARQRGAAERVRAGRRQDATCRGAMGSHGMYRARPGEVGDLRLVEYIRWSGYRDF